MAKDGDKLSRKAAKLGLSRRRRHIFICHDTDKCNCAGEAQMKASWKHLKKRLKRLEKEEGVAVRCSRTHCLDICTGGPVAVVYPEGTWYAGCNEKVLDEIIDRHLVNGEVAQKHVIAETESTEP